ncbi:MAG: EAL domain-containing protein [Dehalococcoidia bacterium]
MRHIPRTFLLALAVVPFALACAPVAPAPPIVRSATPIPAPVASTTHVVAPGETLELIASRYGLSEFDLATLNDIEADTVLEVGQTLTLPDGLDAAAFGPAVDDELLGTAVATRGPAEIVAPPFVIPRPPPWGWYDSMLARPGGELIVVGGGLAILAALAFGLVWLIDTARGTVPAAAASAWRMARSVAREAYFAALWGWIGVRWVGSRLKRFVAVPVSRLLARLLGSGSQHASQAWEASRPVVAAQTGRALDAGGEVLGEQMGEVRKRLDAWLVQRGWRSPAGVRARQRMRSTNRRAESEPSRAAAGAVPAETWPPTESRMLAALEQRELRIEFRPVVNAETGDVAGTLSSVAWDHPSEGLLREQRVLAAMQRPEFGNVRRTLLRTTLADACGLVAQARDRYPEYRAIVPLLSEHLFDPEIEVYVQTAITYVGAPAEGIDLAVDERWVGADIERVATALERLRRIGVRTTLTGYGTLDEAALRRLGVATITVDFFQCLRDAKARSFVEDAVRTARAAGFPVLATGAETADEVALVKELGCSLAAGDAFGGGQSATMLQTGLRQAA